MSKTIPYVLMRAGTSRGPFFLGDWLPADEATRDQVLIGAIGATRRCRCGQTLNRLLNQVLSDQDVVRRFEDHGADVDTSSPAQLRSFVASELDKWRGVVRSAGLAVD